MTVFNSGFTRAKSRTAFLQLGDLLPLLLQRLLLLYPNKVTFSKGNKGCEPVKSHAGTISVRKALSKSVRRAAERIGRITLTLFPAEPGTRAVARRAVDDTSFYTLLEATPRASGPDLLKNKRDSGSFNFATSAPSLPIAHVGVIQPPMTISHL